jgi:hypothetical protein
MDKKIYRKGIKISDNELKEINLPIEKFHEEWNYTIKPKSNCVRPPHPKGLSSLYR